MKKILLTAAYALALISAYAQQTIDSTGFKSRRLKIEEINLVSSYYSQNGENAAVTGGIGSEKLTDIANTIDLTLVKYDKKSRKHSFTGEIGIDHYTSASSDKIDLKANSSASHADTRIYPSLTWSVENENKGTTFGIGASSSSEFDYQSFGGNIFFSKKSKDKNGEFNVKLQTYLDRLKLIAPVELRPGFSSGREEKDYPSASRNSYAGSVSYSQVINQRLSVMLLADVVKQDGYLSLPFHRVYFTDGSVHQENMPDSRFKLPLGIKANYFAGDKVIVRASYRFYTDDWGVLSNTANVEMPVKITPFFSVSPFFRYYDQTVAKYFAGYGQHHAAEEFYTSNYDLSKFESIFFGTGFRIVPPKGVFSNKHFNMLEIRYGHYNRSTKLNSDIITMNLKFR